MHLAHFAGLFAMLVRKHPEIVSAQHVAELFASIATLPFNPALAALIQSLSPVAAHHPSLFDAHREILTRLANDKQSTAVFDCLQTYLIVSIILGDQSTASESLTILIGLLSYPQCTDEMRTAIFSTCLQIGVRHKSILANRRDDLARLHADILLQFIDDRITSETDQAAVSSARLNLEQLIRHTADLQQQRPPVYLSYHPNEQHLVTQLSERLRNAGYACGKIGNQHSSAAKVVICCMSTDYSQSELCTRELQTMLDMSKPVIVLHLDGTVVPIARDSVCLPFPHGEDTFIELIGHLRYVIASKPQIILSCESESQRDMLLLDQRLTRLGYGVWLNVVHVASEEELNEKVERAIRQSSCLLAGITSKYAHSKQGQREIAVAISHRIPVVPLLLEATAEWPSAELARSCIDFSHPTGDEGRWSGKPFADLLARLTLHTGHSKRPKRIASAPVVPESRTCSLM